MQLNPYLIVLLVWLLFGGTHLGLSASHFRENLVSRFGARGFTLIYAAITALSLGAVIVATVHYGHLGRAGFNVEENLPLNIISVAGTFLIISGLLDYPVSPMAALAQRQRQNPSKKTRPLAPPTPLARLTRHPFFVGLALLMAAQALRAPTLATAIYYGGFVILAVWGVYLQDRKLKAKWPIVYGDYMGQTQAVPVPRSNVWSHVSKPDLIKWGLSLVLTFICLTFLRPVWSMWNGAMFGVIILVFGVLATLMGIMKSFRVAKCSTPKGNL